jgi:hypothetical protein
MKKILSLLLLIAPILCFAQAPRVTQTIGTKLTDIKVPGGIKVDSLLRPPLDTTVSAPIGSIAFSSATNKTYQKQADGWWHELIGSVAYSAGTLNIKANGSDQTALLNAVVASSLKEILIDNGTVTISGTFNAQGKKISFKNGGKLTGIGTITNAYIDAGYQDQIFDTTVLVTNLTNSTVSVKWFGAKSDYNPDGTSITWTNNHHIFKKALASFTDVLPSVNFQYFKRLYIPSCDPNKWYALDSTWIVDAAIELYGDGMERTILKFPPGMKGIYLRYPDYPGGFTFKGGRDQFLHDFELIASTGTYGTTAYDGSSHGIYVQTNLTIIERVQVNQFNGDGFCIQANNPGSNANNCLIKECRGYKNSGSGIYLDGADGNQVKIEGGDFSYNARWGYWDGSFLGCAGFGLHTSANEGTENVYNRTRVSNVGNQYYCIKDVVWQVSNNGNRYRCILAHNKPTTIATTEPGVGSAWATYWVLVGPGGPNSQYVDYKISTWQDFTTGTIQPGVSSNWPKYWVFKQVGTYDAGSDVNPNVGAVKKYTDSTQWYTGGGYFFEDGNASGGCVLCYSEGDQYSTTNTSSSMLWSGFLAGNGNSPNGQGIQQGVFTQRNIKLFDPIFKNEFLIDQDTASRAVSTRWANETDGNSIGFRYDNSAALPRLMFYNGSYINDPLIDFNIGGATYASRINRSVIPIHGAIGFGEGIWLGRDNDQFNKRFLGYATIVPVTGEHSAGDWLKYIGSDTTILGFRCLTGGTPGTWLTEKTGNGATVGGAATFIGNAVLPAGFDSTMWWRSATELVGRGIKDSSDATIAISYAGRNNDSLTTRLFKIAQQAATTNQGLGWNGSNWVPTDYVVTSSTNQSIAGQKTFTGKAIFSAGRADNSTQVSDVNYTQTSSDFLIAYTAITASRTVTLNSSSVTSGQHFVIKDQSGSADGTKTIVISGTVDGAVNPVAVNTAYGVYKFYWSGSAWFKE